MKDAGLLSSGAQTVLEHESAFYVMALYILRKWCGFNFSLKGECLGHQAVGFRVILHAFGVGLSLTIKCWISFG